jgi:hypothetical protein
VSGSIELVMDYLVTLSWSSLLLVLLLWPLLLATLILRLIGHTHVPLLKYITLAAHAERARS